MGDALVLMVVDGLGHGPHAADAAREAEQVLAKTSSASPKDLIDDVHCALKKTRGAAMAVDDKASNMAINGVRRDMTARFIAGL